MARKADVPVTTRWGRNQLATLKIAADLFGMPYQSYMKSAALRQALADIRDASGTALVQARELADEVSAEDEEDSPLPPLLGPDGKNLPTLYRSVPIGPFIIGDGPTGKRWTARDVRTNRDKYFGDKRQARADALGWAKEQLAALSEDERATWEAKARERIKPYRNSNRAR